ncbi:MAG: TRAP transporter small permease [Gammaproteobacteria bacterium]
MTTPRWWQRLDRLGAGAENLLLLLSLTAMVLLAVAQIVARNAGIGGMAFSDELLRLLVLWVAMIGAVAASRDDHHIRIDILSRFLPTRVRLSMRVLVDVFTCAVCAIVAWYSLSFVGSTREYEDLAFGKLPLWWFQAVLPVGFALISYRYALWAVRHTIEAWRGDASTEAPHGS